MTLDQNGIAAGFHSASGFLRGGDNTTTQRRDEMTGI